MRKLLTSAMLGSVLLASGCATQTATLQPTQAATPSMTTSHSFYIGGIGQEKTVDAAQVCGGASNVTKVQTMQTGKEVLLSVVTLGIYTPRTAQVYCK
ncbi:Bor family protein [Psychrobacter sp. FDAARGOS_221]|uniref:Bor family protein n=1 Tax=Psychrobacter sp. FDAARGOS_221 TaxID=1975705 RepID=UPI000BB54CFC|nr:Bor family protein [Psychrobacter sp. FDAARGOS_221]PNK60830.1 lipoprotein bor [Psychrobacter sp. FDAARGOS_221]